MSALRIRSSNRSVALTVAAVALCGSMFGAVSSASAMDEVHFQMSWIPTGFYSPMSGGIAKGFYKDEGIDISVSTGRGSGDAVRKVAGGGSPFGDAGMSAVMRGVASEGAPVACLMHLHNHSPHSLFVLESSGIESFTDLPGKRLATTPGNSHYNYFPITARMAGIDPKTVSWVVVDATAMPSMLVNKQVDGVPYWTDNAAFVRPQVEAVGDKLRIIPFADYGFKIYASCMLAHRDVMEENPDLVRRFIKATQRTYLWARDNAEEAARLHKERWPDTKYEDNLNGWLDLRNYIFGADNSIEWTGRFDPEKVQETYNVVAESLELDADFDVTKFYDNSFLPE